jgi:predicted ribosome quality control (RQC) complex YloA/Tae2 family protein
MNLLLLHLLARDAAPTLVGARFGVPSWYAPLFSVPLRAQGGEHHLVAILEVPGPFCFLSPAPALSPARAPARFERLEGRRVAAVRAVPGDRVLEIETHAAGDEEEAMTLRLALYGARARAELRRGEAVLESVGRARGGPRDDERRGPRVSIDTVDAAALASAAAAGALDGPGGPQSAVAGLDPALLAAFSTAAGVDAAALAAFRDGVIAGGTPFALGAAGRPCAAVPVPPAGEAVYARGDEAALAVGRDLLADAHRRILARLLRPVRRRLTASRSLADNLRRDLERAAGHERVRREAETLAAFRSRVPTGAAHVTLSDVYDPERTVEIELDPAMSLESQIQARFRKATKLARSAEHAGRRLALVEREARELETALRLFSETASFAESLQRLETLRAKYDIDGAVAVPGRRRRQKAPPAPSFRRYDIDATWFVLVGRDNRENDDLTFHHARPDDLWFHAQGVSGSHVVLKSRGGVGAPSGRVIEAAASVAAHFSKARHSGLVPVIYTRRKYVRRFRGARPGQVACEREKMVMVPPELPALAPGDEGQS